MISVKIDGISEHKLREILDVIGSEAVISIRARREVFLKNQKTREKLICSVLTKEFM